MKYHIEQACRIRFAQPAREHHVQIRLTPWDDESQSLVNVVLRVEPSADPVASYDCFGNLSHHFAVLGSHRELSFSIAADVETRRENPFDFSLVPPERERAWIADSLRQAPRLWDFVLHRSALVPTLADEVSGREIPEYREGVSLIEQVQAAFGWVGCSMRYDPALEASGSDLSAPLAAGRGSAADLAHLLIALVRHWQVPARFVSGYLDAAYFDDSAQALGAISSQRLHHWVEVLIPGGGWRGFDPALELAADATYVRVAIGRDADDIRPLRQACRSDGEGPELDESLMVSRVS
ncbi:transglutaminase family protein [Imhoffiella purpurea]|uniref:Transglutaminase n=1 Tax=Imhoffiella purpurea TaxID=1249627 RepID=W9VXC3_9GAMM|nr:transglutaminase family protein [Imhoffiella purpurea]EXJ15080.1 transglutaminase [Imhoffiella purpurea]